MTESTTNTALLTDQQIAEIADMFPHAEYQPTLSPDEVDPCEFCKGTIDDHKANCVVPHVHALIATVKQLRDERDVAMKVLEPSMPESGLEDACRQLKQAYISEAGNCETLESQLEQLRTERDFWRTRATEASKAAEKWYHERY